MIVVFARHKVNDYATWKAVFEANEDIRKAGGEISHRIFHAIEDPNDIGLMFEWESLEKAHQFMSSPELKAKMIEAGVVGEPIFDFLKEY